MNYLSLIKPIVFLIVVALFAVSGYYLINLKSNLQVEKNNVELLKKVVSNQQEIVYNMKSEIDQVRESQTSIIDKVLADGEKITSLQSRIDADRLERLSKARPKSIERIVNRGTKNAMRCLEIASGSPITTQELEVRLLSDANKECSWIHPNLNP